MSIRSTESLVTFRNSFMLPELELEQPAGTYKIVVDEEEIAGLSFLAYRRVATMIHIPSLEAAEFSRQVFLVDSDELQAAISADHRSMLAKQRKGLAK